MKLISIANWPGKINGIVKRHGYNPSNYTIGFALLNTKKQLLAYTLIIPPNTTTSSSLKVSIDWIYAKLGYGTRFLQQLETLLFKTYEKIELLVSLDRNERDSSVMRRMNFYIKNKYRVSGIRYRSCGPILTMFKINPNK